MDVAFEQLGAQSAGFLLGFGNSFGGFPLTQLAVLAKFEAGKMRTWFSAARRVSKT